MGKHEAAINAVGAELAKDQSFLDALMARAEEDTTDYAPEKELLRQRLNSLNLDTPTVALAMVGDGDYLLAFCFSKYHELRKEAVHA